MEGEGKKMVECGIYCAFEFLTASHYKSKTISGTGFLNFLPISELTLTVLISTGQYRSNESEVES